MHRSMHRLDVVDFLKQGGRDFQARMNAVLRRDMEAETERTP
ncbi:BrnA antitoxin family protein [Methylobacterium radiodurans]|nr:BrnA antitoxin family protein [Methylobacterium radiodurans]